MFPLSQIDSAVKDVMSTKVVTIEGGATVKEAASIMTSRKCSCLVVLRSGIAYGILTERDLVRKVLAIWVDPSKVLVSDVASTPLVTIGGRSTVADAAKRMSEYLIRRLVVVDERGAMVGLLTAGDIAKLLAKKAAYSDTTLNALARMKQDGTGGPYG